MTELLEPVDVREIRELLRPVEPVASVYLGGQPGGPSVDSGEDLQLRWRGLANNLLRQGAPVVTVAALARFVRSLEVAPVELAAFATGDAIVLRHWVEDGAGFDRAAFAAPAQVVPLLAWRNRRPPHVQVIIDRAGADVTAVPRGAVAGETHTVMGPDDEIERNAPGGWAQPRYQRRAEDSWRHNAAAVAEAVAGAAKDVEAELILVGGDVRAVTLLRERLPEGLRRLAGYDLPGGRSPDGSADARAAAVLNHLAEFASAQTRALLDQFEAERPHGLAVEGVADTLAALAQGRVRTLLIADSPDDARAAWFAETVLCVDDSFRPGVADADKLRPGRLVDIAVRAALLTDADVHVVDQSQITTLAEQVGALCRFAD